MPIPVVVFFTAAYILFVLAVYLWIKAEHKASQKVSEDITYYQSATEKGLGSIRERLAVVEQHKIRLIEEHKIILQNQISENNKVAAIDLEMNNLKTKMQRILKKRSRPLPKKKK